MSASGAKFVLCDPSLSGAGGHYMDYDVWVLNAARARGFQPVLVSNDAYRGVECVAGIGVRPLFKYEIWGRLAKGLRAPERGLSPEDKRFLRLMLSEPGVHWVAAGSIRNFQHYTGEYGIDNEALAGVRRAVALRRVYDQLLARAPELEAIAEYPPGVRRRTAEHRLKRSLLRHAIRAAAGDPQAAGALAPPAAIEPVDAELLTRLAHTAHVAEEFRRSLEQLDADVGLTSGDEVFFPNMSFMDLKGLSEFLSGRAVDEGVRYHVLFRRNIYSSVSTRWETQEWEVHSRRAALNLFKTAHEGRQVLFHTDTELLTAQYERLDGPRFTTLPVPVDLSVDPEATATPDPRGLLYLSRGLDFASRRLFRLFVAAPQLAQRAGRAAFQAPRLDASTGAADRRGWRALSASVEVLSAEVEPLVAARLAGTAQIVAIDADPAELIGSTSHPAWRALEGGGRLLTASGTWLAELVEALNTEAMRGVLAGAAGTPVQPSGWRRSLWTGKDLADRGAVRGQEVLVNRAGASRLQHLYSWLALPEGVARELIIEVSTRERAQLAVRVAAFGAETELAVRERPLGAGEQPTLLAFDIPDGARRLWVGLRSLAEGDVWVRPTFRIVSGVGASKRAEGAVVLADLDEASAIRSLEEALEDLQGAPPARSRGAAWREAYRNARRSRCAYDFTYLGDARDEKGFGALPAMVAAAGGGGPNPVSLVSQGYTAFDNTDPAMLVALQLLRRKPGVSLVERSLSSSDYNRYLLDSDCILVPYDAQNYAARSSGIFAQAAAAGKPAIVPGGSWMAHYIDRDADAHHDQVLAGSELLSRIEPVEASDFVLYGGAEGPMPAWRASGGGVLAREHDTVVINVPGLRKAGYVRLSFEHAEPNPDIVVGALFAYQGAQLDDYRWVVGGGGARLSILSPVPAGATRCWLGLQTPMSAQGARLHGIRVDVLVTQEPVALMPYGMTYAPAPDNNALGARLAECAREIAAHYSTYRDTAARAADTWAASFTAEALVDRMLAAVPGDVSDVGRFAVRDLGDA